MQPVDQSLTLADYRAGDAQRLERCREVMRAAEACALECRQKCYQTTFDARSWLAQGARYHELALLHESYAQRLRAALEGGE